MAPIRVGIIGLSPAKKYSGAGTWAAATHLPALQNLPDEYRIVALANSSVESAKRSAAAHNFPSSVKTYGSAEDLAGDPEVDLVVVSVRVKKHYELVKPALLNKKMVLVEWPLAATADEVEELAQLATETGVETAVGVQARAAPVLQKVKEILTSGDIGTVLSSTAVIASSFKTDAVPDDIKYALDFSSGGNEFTVIFGHFLDYFIEVLGDIEQPQAILEVCFPTSKVLDSNGQVLDAEYPKTVPDHILVQGVTDMGVLASLTFYRSTGTVDGEGMRWIIAGTKGEITITAPDKLQMADKAIQLQVKISGKSVYTPSVDSYRIVAADTVPEIAVNMVSMYAGFAKSDRTKYATFESAAKTHRLLDRIRVAAGYILPSEAQPSKSTIQYVSI